MHVATVTEYQLLTSTAPPSSSSVLRLPMCTGGDDRRSQRQLTLTALGFAFLHPTGRLLGEHGGRSERSWRERPFGWRCSCSPPGQQWSRAGAPAGRGTARGLSFEHQVKRPLALNWPVAGLPSSCWALVWGAGGRFVIAPAAVEMLDWTAAARAAMRS